MHSPNTFRSETIRSSWACALSEQRSVDGHQFPIDHTGSSFQLASPSDLAAMMLHTARCEKDVQTVTQECQELRSLLIEERSRRQQAEVDKASVLQVLRESGTDVTHHGDSFLDLATQAGNTSLRKLLQGCQGEQAREFLAAEVTQLDGKELVDLVQDMIQQIRTLHCNEVDLRERLRILMVECGGLRAANEGLATLTAVKQALVKERLKSEQLQRSLQRSQPFSTATIARRSPQSAASRLELVPSHTTPPEDSPKDCDFVDTIQDAAASMFKGRSSFLGGGGGTPCNFEFKRDTPLIGIYTILPLINENKPRQGAELSRSQQNIWER